MYKNQIETKYKANRGHQLCSQKMSTNGHASPDVAYHNQRVVAAARARAAFPATPGWGRWIVEMGKTNNRSVLLLLPPMTLALHTAATACAGHRCRHLSRDCAAPKSSEGEAQAAVAAWEFGLATRPSPASRRRKRTCLRYVLFFFSRSRETDARGSGMSGRVLG
jgi:hypothetical protein